MTTLKIVASIIGFGIVCFVIGGIIGRKLLMCEAAKMGYGEYFKDGRGVARFKFRNKPTE